MNEAKILDDVHCNETEIFRFGAKVIRWLYKRLAPVHFMTFNFYCSCCSSTWRIVRWRLKPCNPFPYNNTTYTCAGADGRDIIFFFCIRNNSYGTVKELKSVLNLG
jgi:hypothetical protein